MSIGHSRLPRSPWTVARRAGLCLLVPALLLLAGGAGREVRAAEGDTQTLIYIGSSLISIDNATTQGTTIGARWGYEFLDDLLWTVGGAYTATDGTQSVAGTDYQIHANTTTLQTGALYFFGRRPRKLVVPFVGAGIAALDYDVDYRYPGSKTGKTSGTEPAPSPSRASNCGSPGRSRSSYPIRRTPTRSRARAAAPPRWSPAECCWRSASTSTPGADSPRARVRPKEPGPHAERAANLC